MYPDDSILLARGKYATLSRERRQQIKRVQDIGTRLLQAQHTLVAALQADVPSIEMLAMMRKDLDQFEDAGNKLIQLCAQIEELKPIAWDAT